jgi:hypothetical protein
VRKCVSVCEREKKERKREKRNIVCEKEVERESVCV